MAASQLVPDDDGIQIVMGVMYSVARNFQEAADAFGHASAADPTNYTTLSRWGACLSNAGDHAAALQKYDAALKLNPGFARCWLNKGIACFKLQQYEAAAKAHLTALKLNPAAVHVWPHVRIALTCMERFDLVPATHACDIPTLCAALGIPASG